MKKSLIALLFLSFINFTYSQEVKLTEENHYFLVGSKNALVVTIPFGNKDIIEKELRRELKDWNGKYDSGKGEYFTLQATTKAMGPKPFDAYSKIITQSDVINVVFAFDLGGAFLSSKEHSQQFREMSEEIKAFARKTSLACINEELEKENKTLSGLEKDLRSLEKDKSKLAEDIEDYKKKILDAERKIETNLQEQNKNKDDIKKQIQKISEVEKKKVNLK
ncbi:MAG: hypothetical protein V4622_12705 [Bacteroidota bacterium]